MYIYIYRPHPAPIPLWGHMPIFWPRYNNYAVQNITFKHTKGLGKGNQIINIRYYLSVRIPDS